MTKTGPKTKRPPRLPPRASERHFVGAKDEEKRDAYLAKLTRLETLVRELRNGIVHASVGSEAWRKIADRVARTYDNAGGKTVEVAARELLLRAIDDAMVLVNMTKEDKFKWYAEARRFAPVIRSKTPHRYPDWKEAREWEFRHGNAFALLEDGGHPLQDPEELVTFTFGRGCEEYAAALKTEEAQARLTETLRVWGARGRTRTGEDAPPSMWKAAYELIRTIGIADVSQETFESKGRTTLAKHKENRGHNAHS